MKISFLSAITLFTATLFTTTLISCIGPTSKSSLEPRHVPMSEHLIYGKKLLDARKYEASLQEFDAILKEQTTTPEVPKALYYSARALQELGQWREASERLRKFTTTFGGQASELMPEAFFRLGLSYEAMNDNGGAIAAFIDALNRIIKTQSPLRVELQARLAGLYALMGNEAEAQRLYDGAEKDLLNLRRQQVELPSWLPETLYDMGKMSLRAISPDNFEGSLRPLERAQIWLLQVARLNDSRWSELAAKELIKVYQEAWAKIQSAPLFEDNDKLIALRDQQDRRINMAVSLYNVVAKLRLERGYDFSAENKYEKMIFDSLAPIEEGLEILLKSRPVEQSLTPAAVEKDSLKRKGKLVDPTDDDKRKDKINKEPKKTKNRK